MNLVLPATAVHTVYLVFDHDRYPMLAPKDGQLGERFAFDEKDPPKEYHRGPQAPAVSLPQRLLDHPFRANGEPVTYPQEGARLATVFGFTRPSRHDGPHDVPGFRRALEVFLYHYTWTTRWYARKGSVWVRLSSPNPI